VRCGVLIVTMMNTAIWDVSLYIVVVRSFKIDRFIPDYTVSYLRRC
jgi:hypothetical protein